MQLSSQTRKNWLKITDEPRTQLHLIVCKNKRGRGKMMNLPEIKKKWIKVLEKKAARDKITNGAVESKTC